MIKENDEYGIYIVKQILDEKSSDHHRLYLIKCNICGKEFKKSANKFAAPSAIAYSCQHNKNNWITKNERLENIFSAMKARCYNAEAKSYKFYGAKKIKICDEWLNNPCEFETWAITNGYQDNLTIDRIDPTKEYCPENCRWISFEDNARFKSTTNYIEVNGMLKSGRQWSEYLGYGINYINRMIRNKGLEYTKQFIKDKLTS